MHGNAQIKNTTRLISAVALLSVFFLSSCKPPKEAETETIQYGIRNDKIPLRWSLSGSATGCPPKLAVPAEINAAIRKAWSSAESLLVEPMDAMVGKTSGNFLLKDVELLVGSEGAFLFSGCINKKSEARADSTLKNSDATITSTNGPMEAKCISTKAEVANILNKPLQAESSCGSANLSAGFALRSSIRQISVTAQFLINGASKTYPKMPLTIDVHTIDMAGNVNASLGSLGAALLSFGNPAIQMAANTLLDQMGGSMKAAFAQQRTVLPDESPRWAFRPKSNSPDATNLLAVKIADTILQDACNDYQERNGGNKSKCNLVKITKKYCNLDALKLYHKIPVTNCVSKGPNSKFLYGWARKPSGSAERDYLELDETKLTVYHPRGGASDAWQRQTWGVYAGTVVQNPEATCGKLTQGKKPSEWRCIQVNVGAFVGGFGQGNCHPGVEKLLSLDTRESIDSSTLKTALP
ncbi:MAG: hypothetical protein RI953_1242 [Pseudomonadota bacterium]|jgi:hypothetical protein